MKQKTISPPRQKIRRVEKQTSRTGNQGSGGKIRESWETKGGWLTRKIIFPEWSCPWGTFQRGRSKCSLCQTCNTVGLCLMSCLYRHLLCCTGLYDIWFLSPWCVSYKHRMTCVSENQCESDHVVPELTHCMFFHLSREFWGSSVRYSLNFRFFFTMVIVTILAVKKRQIQGFFFLFLEAGRGLS